MESLNAQQRSYVESMGLFFEESGSQLTLGKVIGLLFIAERPLCQEDMMRLLRLSRTSTSTALHWASEHLGYVERVSLPGDRKRYYQIRSQMTDWFARSSSRKLEEYLQLLMMGEAVADPGAQERLTRMRELVDLLKVRIEAALEDWRQKQQSTLALGALLQGDKQTTAGD